VRVLPSSIAADRPDTRVVRRALRADDRCDEEPILRIHSVRRSDGRPGCWKWFAVRITPKFAPAPTHFPNSLKKRHKTVLRQSSYLSSYNEMGGYGWTSVAIHRRRLEFQSEVANSTGGVPDG
jgi:hypothetical protein